MSGQIGSPSSKRMIKSGADPSLFLPQMLPTNGEKKNHSSLSHMQQHCNFFKLFVTNQYFYNPKKFLYIFSKQAEFAPLIIIKLLETSSCKR
jgi:hypothetical protein